jgi:hypothetical protein
MRQPAPQIVSRGEFMRRTSAICARASSDRARELSAFLTRRSQQASESLGPVGEFEMVRKVVTPSLRREIGQLEKIGLPNENGYEAEALWQTLRIVLHEVEIEGLYAWRSAKLLIAFRNRAKMFGLESCLVN